MRMSESDVGFRLAVTLQKAGRRGNDTVLLGGVKAPLSIVFASVIEIVGEASFERFSQDSAWSMVGKKAPPTTIIERISFRAMIRKYILLPCSRGQRERISPIELGISDRALRWWVPHSLRFLQRVRVLPFSFPQFAFPADLQRLILRLHCLMFLMTVRSPIRNQTQSLRKTTMGSTCVAR